MALRHLGAVRLAFGHEALGPGVATLEQRLGLQAAPYRLPMGPGLGLHPDPLQPVFHPARNFLMKPGRARGRDAIPMPRGSGVDGGRALVGHKVRTSILIR